MAPNNVTHSNNTAVNADQDTSVNDDSRRRRYDSNRQDDGSALSQDRNQMYDDLTDVGESGTQGSETGREDQNKIGPNGQP